MKKILIAALFFAASASALAQTPAADASFKLKVATFIDEWHDDAAHARWAYFDKMAKNGVYIGTDKSELWSRDEFKAWAKRFFDKGKAWSFKSTKRNIYFSPDKHYVWFDEQLATQMGVCQASGVIHNTGKGFEIEHYQLSMAVPNEVNDKVVSLIKEAEAAEAKK
ncbi:MAG: nuclear transport factor 2 family protein [Pseudomonadota bacterium]